MLHEHHRQFLEEVRRNDKMDIQSQWFMSDDASQYYNAWETSFDHQPHKLLCNWHVERERESVANAAKEIK